MFTAMLFTIVKIWNQPKCLSMNEWIKKYDIFIIQPLKKVEILPFVTTWMVLEGITSSKISQRKTRKNNKINKIKNY